MQINRHKPVQIMRFYTSLLEEGISEEFVQYLHIILKKSFTTAIKWGLLKNNIMNKVDKPRRKRKEMQVWTLEEATRFLEEAKKSRPHFYMLYLLAIFTGMRKGEILALRWKDCMLDERKISVSKTLSYIKGQGIVCQETKTERSNRIISISDTVIEELKRYRIHQQKVKLMLGNAYQDNGYIIAKENGEPLNPNYVFNHFKKLLQKASVPPIRFHDLRHTHATIMLGLGEHPKIVSERLGHSSIQITLNTYSHVTYDMQKEASDRFEQAIKQHKQSL
jgi:integrase